MISVFFLLLTLLTIGYAGYLTNNTKVDKIDLYGIYDYFAKFKKLSLSNSFFAKLGGVLILALVISSSGDFYKNAKQKAHYIYNVMTNNYVYAVERRRINQMLQVDANKGIPKLKTHKSAKALGLQPSTIKALKTNQKKNIRSINRLNNLCILFIAILTPSIIFNIIFLWKSQNN